MSTVGCGSGVKVTGTTQFNDKPLPGAEVVFKRQGGKEVFAAVSRNDGTFLVAHGGGGGIPPGTYEVTVTFWVNARGEFPPATEEGEAQKARGAYVQVAGTSTHEVSSGNSTVQISLDSQSVKRVGQLEE